MIDYSNCLRPIFTKQIFEKLLDDKSLNPFGVKGIGKKRLLNDLETLAKEAGIKIVRIDMKGYADSYARFLEHMEENMKKISSAPLENTPLLMTGKRNEPIKSLPSVSKLIKHTKIEAQEPIILIENFDTLIGTKAHQFPKSFFIDLNYIKGKLNIRLCCTTEKSHKNSQLYFEGGRSKQTSFLDLEPIGMPLLTMREIRNFLLKELMNNPLWKKCKEIELYVKFIYNQKELSLKYMNLLVNDIKYPYSPTESYKQRSTRIKKQYEEGYEVKHPPLKDDITFEEKIERANSILDFVLKLKKLGCIGRISILGIAAYLFKIILNFMA